MEKSPPAPRAVPPRIQSAPVGANPDDISAIFSNLSFSNFLRDPLDEEGGVPPLPSDNVPQQPPPPTHQRSVPPGLAGQAQPPQRPYSSSWGGDAGAEGDVAHVMQQQLVEAKQQYESHARIHQPEARRQQRVGGYAAASAPVNVDLLDEIAAQSLSADAQGGVGVAVPPAIPSAIPSIPTPPGPLPSLSPLPAAPPSASCAPSVQPPPAISPSRSLPTLSPMPSLRELGVTLGAFDGTSTTPTGLGGALGDAAQH